MKSKCGPGVLQLAAYLSAIGDCFFPMSTAAAATDAWLLLASGPTTHTSTLTGSYKSRLYGYNPTDNSGLQNDLTEETASLIASTIYINPEEASYSTSPSVTEVHSAVTQSRDTFSTESPDTPWMTANLTAGPENHSPGTGRVTGTEYNTNSSPSPSSVSVSVTATAMETDAAVCIRPTGLRDAEVLAVVVGAVFITLLLSALLYQLCVFMKKRKNKRGSCICIIENEFYKYGLEANKFQQETKL